MVLLRSVVNIIIYYLRGDFNNESGKDFCMGGSERIVFKMHFLHKTDPLEKPSKYVNFCVKFIKKVRHLGKIDQKNLKSGTKILHPIQIITLRLKNQSVIIGT